MAPGHGVLVDVLEGRLLYSPTKTVETLADEWLDAIGPNRKATTAANYRMLVGAYVVPNIGSKRLDRLTVSDLQRLYSELRRSGGRGGKPLSGTQVRNVHRVLHNMLSYARRMGYLAVYPANVVEKPREDTPERTVNTPEQVRLFLTAARDDRLGALWHLVVTRVVDEMPANGSYG
jgi:integrase